MKRITGMARVQITVEVETSSWGEDCCIKQLYEQAAESGLANVTEVFAKAGKRVRIIGMPKVIGVITESE